MGMPVKHATDAERIADLEGLLPFATDSQAETIRAVVAHGTQTAAAKALGVIRETVSSAIAKARKRAAYRGYAPEFGRTRVIPETEQIKGVSTLVNADGTTNREWIKTGVATSDPADPPLISAPVEAQSTMTDAQGRRIVTWERRVVKDEQLWAAVIAACKSNADGYEGKARRTMRGKKHVGLSKDLLEIYPIGDAHIGLLTAEKETGQDFDLKIAERELDAGIDLLAEQARPASSALIINVGDWHHVDNDSQLTPRGGHKLSADSRIWKIMQVAWRVACRTIDRALAVHDAVDMWNVPGNHDPILVLAMNMYLQAFYRNEPRVRIIDNFEPYFYRRFGKCLIGACHGHLAKMVELQGIMSTDRAEDWGATTFRHWFTGHVHHDKLIEMPGCVAESVRTLAAPDHYAKSRWRSRQGIQAITFHSAYGLIARRNVDRELVMARLDGVL